MEIDYEKVKNAIAKMQPSVRVLGGFQKQLDRGMIKTVGEIRGLMDDELDALVKGLGPATPITIKRKK